MVACVQLTLGSLKGVSASLALLFCEQVRRAYASSKRSEWKRSVYDHPGAEGAFQILDFVAQQARQDELYHTVDDDYKVSTDRGPLCTSK